MKEGNTGKGIRYGGRQKGTKNKVNRDARAVINALLPPKERYGLLKELAQGVATKDENGKIYTCKPDVVALKFLAEMADGKAAQSVDVTSKGEKMEVGIVYKKAKDEKAV
jgi:hypothetical protein